jgi:hypothetical protein
MSVLRGILIGMMVLAALVLIAGVGLFVISYLGGVGRP